MATTGASVSTIEASLEMPPGTLSRYLRKGAEEKAGPYKTFYMKYRKWVSEAKHVAESNMASKSPEKWLDRNTSAKLIETEEESALVPTTNAPNNPSTLHVGAQQALAAIAALRAAGTSIDELLDKGELSVNDSLSTPKLED